MRYTVLATDYDGTLASQGIVEAKVVAALDRFRRSGRILILVTGRELDELLGIFPEVTLFHRVVAENGGLLYCPQSGRQKVLGEPPSSELVRTLIDRGVQPLSVGRSIVATFEPHESTVLAAIRDLGLELQVIAVNPNLFEALAAQDTAVELSGQLKTVAVSLMKIANDLRWMNSGPLSGLGEVSLPALQPGSSIMPGKVNPVIPEAVAMVCARVIGNDTSITIAGQSGNFQLNVMLPLIAHDLLQSIELLGRAARALGERAIAGMTYDVERMKAQLLQNPILVTALNGIIGYEQGSKIARQAYAEGRAIVDVALEHVDMSREELERLLDPEALTRPASSG
jgi:fumarate hydratase class II